jgi:hypothetical protein
MSSVILVALGLLIALLFGKITLTNLGKRTFLQNHPLALFTRCLVLFHA